MPGTFVSLILLQVVRCEENTVGQCYVNRRPMAKKLPAFPFSSDFELNLDPESGCLVCNHYTTMACIMHKEILLNLMG